VSVKIIAEGEINHNGDVEIAKKLVESAKECGADYIKFQCFVAKNFVAPGSSFLSIFEDNEMSLEDFKAVKIHAEKVGIAMISTASDLLGLEMIEALDLPVIKVGSTNLTNEPLLEGIAKAGRPVWLSTGASTLGEVERAVEIVSSGTTDITLFHCTVQYPAKDDQLNLRAIPTLKAAFPDLEVAYSDHTVGNHAAIAAVTLGATMIEKHFTLDNDMEGPDHGFSINPENFKTYIQDIRTTETILGSARKAPSSDEVPLRLSARRYITTGRAIAKGEKIEAGMVLSRRIDVGQAKNPGLLLTPADEAKIVGWTITEDLADGDAVTLANCRPTV